MADLHDRVEADLRTAMKARDKPRVAALRMAVAALKNAAVAEGAGPQGRLSDEGVQRILATEVKRRREAAKAFADAGRDEQAASEEAEIAVYAAYLPTPLSDEELAATVDRVVTEVGAQGPQDLGAVMKAVMPAVAGRADGSRVSAAVRERLG